MCDFDQCLPRHSLGEIAVTKLSEQAKIMAEKTRKTPGFIGLL